MFQSPKTLGGWKSVMSITKEETISNLEHNFNEEDFLVTTSVEEDRQLLFESYLFI